MDDCRDNWNEMYELAKNYYNYHHNLLIKHSFKTINGYVYDQNGKSLGNWIDSQRVAYRAKKILEELGVERSVITDEQIEKLKYIGMVFENFYELYWNEMYKLAREYYNNYNNLNVSYKFKTIDGYNYDENGKKLGIWIKHQREAYLNRTIPKEERKNCLKPLTDEQVEKLESIGMIFEVKLNQSKNRKLCMEYNFNYEDGMYLINNMLHGDFSARINFLFANNLPLKVNGETNDIFFMSSSNLEAVYGLTREELITKYYKEYEKGNVKVRKI